MCVVSEKWAIIHVRSIRMTKTCSWKATYSNPILRCLSVSVLSCSFVSDSLWPQGLQRARMPCPWDSLGTNTRVGCHFLLPCDVYHSIIYNIKQWKNFNKYLVFGEWVICMILIYVLKIIKIISFLYNFYIKVFLFLYNFKKWNIF